MKNISICIVLIVLFCLFFGVSQNVFTAELSKTGNFSISKIVICDPDDQFCKPLEYCRAGRNIRINVLENYDPGLIGQNRDLILYFYDINHKELLKASKFEQYIWGPHINDRWLCFLPDNLDSGVYEIKIVARMGQKEYEKSISFIIKNILEKKRVEEDINQPRPQPSSAPVNQSIPPNPDVKDQKRPPSI